MFGKLWEIIREGAMWFAARGGSIDAYVKDQICKHLEPAVSTPARKVLTGSMLVIVSVVAFYVAPWLTTGACISAALWHAIKRIGQAVGNRECQCLDCKETRDVTTIIWQELLLVVPDSILFSASLVFVGARYVKEGLKEDSPEFTAADAA